MGLGDLFKSKKEKAIRRAMDPTKDNMSRVKALNYLEDEAKAGDDQSLETILKVFSITVKPDKQEQSLTPYDDEAEKRSLTDRLIDIGDRERVVKHLRKELSTPPWLTPGRRDPVVYLVEALIALAEATTDDEEDADEMVLDELVRALTSYDPEETYKSNERKVELVNAVGRFRSRKAAEAILPYLDDVDETVRFNAADALANAGDDSLTDALAPVILDDESGRNREKAAETLAALRCVIKGHPRRKEIEAVLPPDVMVDKQGVVKRRS